MAIGLGVFCSTSMFASRYSRTMMGKILLERLEAKNEPIDLLKVIGTIYIHLIITLYLIVYTC